MNSYVISRDAAETLAGYLLDFMSHDDNASEIASALFALVNGDADEIILEQAEA